MSIFNQMIRGNQECVPTYPSEGLMKEAFKPRTFKETINDQIAYHLRKVDELNAVKDSLTPEVEAFVEAIQRLG